MKNNSKYDEKIHIIINLNTIHDVSRMFRKGNDNRTDGQ